MREIKFKFWLGHTKKMTYSHDLKDVNKIIPEFTKDIIPLQFTGLKDSEGKEIYEGDILDDGKQKWKVVFQRGGFHLDDGNSLPSFGIKHIEFKLKTIGNIYDNPELLKD